jgi:hypothetical protein
MDWFADIIQKPEKILGKALIVKGKQGCGKNCFFDWFGNKVLGGNLYKYNGTNLDRLFDNFSNVCVRRLLCLCDEVKGQSSHKYSEDIKGLITATTIINENKGQTSYKVSNLCRFVFLTNNEIPVKIEESDRRFIMYEMSSDFVGNTEYFDNLYDNIFEDEKIAQTFYNLLKNRKINYKRLKNPPKTSIYNNVKEASLPKEYLFLKDYFNLNDKTTEIKSSDLYNNYKKYLEVNYPEWKTNITKFGLIITKIFEKVQKGGGYVYYILDNEKFDQFIKDK